MGRAHRGTAEALVVSGLLYSQMRLARAPSHFLKEDAVGTLGHYLVWITPVG